MGSAHRAPVSAPLRYATASGTRVCAEVILTPPRLKNAAPRFRSEWSVRNRKPPVGRALTAEEQEAPFAVAQAKPACLYAYVASTLAFYCRFRAWEAKRCAGRTLTGPGHCFTFVGRNAGRVAIAAPQCDVPNGSP